MTDIAVMNAKEAIAKHMNWRITLQLAVTMEEQLTPEQVSAIHHHRHCAIGRWLDSPANLSMRMSPAYRDVVARHFEFHREMILISRLIADRCFTEASAAMKANSGFMRTSVALARAITVLDQVRQMAVPL